MCTIRSRDNIMFFFLSFAFVFFTLVGCGDVPKESKKMSPDSISFTTVPVEEEIAYMVLEPRGFQKELLANGRLAALHKANLRFRTDGIIRSVSVREGEQVRQGEVIAVLDGRQSEQGLSTAKLALQQAKLDYEDQLLRAGYKLADSTKIAPGIKAVARIRSGLERAELDLRQAELAVGDNRLLAPFGGKVASLKAKAYNNSTAYDFICTLVDEQQMEVVFYVLEQELPFVRGTDNVEIRPFGSKPSGGFNARIRSINPLVDEKGMVEIKAVLQGKPGILMDGMNVDIRLRQNIPAQLVVPKEAVLDRQNRKVVFTLVDSLARWNYVEIGGENSDSYLITGGLKVGDKVIHKGNFNLSHDKVVKVSEQH